VKFRFIVRLRVLNSIIVHEKFRYFSGVSTPGLTFNFKAGSILPYTLTFKYGKSVRLNVGLFKSELNVIVTFP